MVRRSTGRRGREGATAAAGLLVIAALVLVVLGLRGQVEAPAPPASGAHPAIERDLRVAPAPPTPTRASATPGKDPTASATKPGTAPSRTHHPATPDLVGPVLPRSKPVALTIPAIDIQHARLAAYGTNIHGAINVPAPTGGVPPGWYTGSPTPGQAGPAVIVGHTDGAKDGRSVFFRLGEVRPGNLIRVTRADHTVAVFNVDSIEEYPKNAFPTQTVYGNISHAGLRLISCIGEFDQSTGHYRDNIVVYAHLVTSHPR